jgi:lipopolysaccharide/colanic/teichoic acid biosynthesis glycosyltransferase
MAQRFLDIILSGAALLVLSPLLVPVVIVLRLTGEGEVFFGQNRVGRGGGQFRLLKFATMLRNSPNMGTGTVTLRDDPRILPVGRFLRKTKINELPQLLNILKGDMSVIGPRPQTQRCFDAFPERSQKAIVTVRPGLSGIGSIVFRGEEDMMHAAGDPDHFYDHVIMPYKGRLEEWYVTHQGVWTYLLLIALTVWVVLNPRSRLVWRAFPDLPPPPDEIALDVNWMGGAGISSPTR